jgi:hypothetical protein
LGLGVKTVPDCLLPSRRGKYWESRDNIPEPHGFDVKVAVTDDAHAHTYQTAFAEHEHHHGDVTVTSTTTMSTDTTTGLPGNPRREPRCS